MSELLKKNSYFIDHPYLCITTQLVGQSTPDIESRILACRLPETTMEF